MQQAIFAGGCFWCIEAVFNQLEGVQSAQSGYIGGARANPNYEQVCTGATGHAEAVRIEFDEQKISYQQLLEVFFFLHDPTQLNRQGNDIGTQYRSAIFYTNLAQKQQAEQAIKAQQAHWQAPIVTEICAEMPFYPAEDYHQGYFQKQTDNRYCQLVVSPKYLKAQKQFQGWWKSN